MIKTHLDYLDKLVGWVLAGKEDAIEGLSTGEWLYVALAANRPDLLLEGYTIAQALWRLDDGWVEELIRRWRSPSGLPSSDSR